MRIVCAAVTLLALFGWAAEMDSQAAQADQAYRCEMVREGNLPDRAGEYWRDCATPILAPR